MDATTGEVSKETIITAPITRRRFLFTMAGFAWTCFGLCTTEALAIVGRYFFPNVVFEPGTTFKAGFPNQYNEIGKVYTQWKEKYGVWIVRATDEIYCLLAVCTHLGCTPNWLEAEQKFKCPCHGSGFYESGINFEGPAPRPLERVKLTLDEDGQILIDKSKTFRQELGQWQLPGSFLPV